MLNIPDVAFDLKNYHAAGIRSRLIAQPQNTVISAWRNHTNKEAGRAPRHKQPKKTHRTRVVFSLKRKPILGLSQYGIHILIWGILPEEERHMLDQLELLCLHSIFVDVCCWRPVHMQLLDTIRLEGFATERTCARVQQSETSVAKVKYRLRILGSHNTYRRQKMWPQAMA